jgi:glycerol kinase
MNKLKKFILSIDQSTSATKVVLFDHKARLVYRVSIQHRQIYPKPGFVEHDPLEIYDNIIRGIKEIIKKTKTGPDEIACLSITNQRETALIWDRNTGEPVANAAVWQCQRGADICSNLLEQGYGKMISDKTGLIINSYFSASKLQYIINNTRGIKEKAEKGELLLGTMDTWLLWKLTDGKVHSTDYSNACRTMLFNIHTLQWDEELIKLFDLYPSMFPGVKYSDMIFGDAAPVLGFSSPLPIAGLIGDSHGALFGQHCFSTGMTKATYGTGSSIMMNIGKSPGEAPEGMVTSIGFSLNKSIDYVFEGNIHSTGDTINWLVNELQLIQSTHEAEQIAGSVKNNGGVYLVPAFVGLGAPYWNQDARACICGISRQTTKAHIVRAALESIAYQVKDLIDLMIEKAGIELRELRVDGGPTRNDFLMQFQTDILQKTVVRSDIEEISALGSAMLAGLATDFWKDLDEIEKLRIVDKTFQNNMPGDEIERLYSGWKLAVNRTLLK